LTKYCHKCGKDNDDEAIFCRHCGERLAEIPSKNNDTNTNKTEKNKKAIIFFILFALFIGSIGAIAVATTLNTNDNANDETDTSNNTYIPPNYTTFTADDYKFNLPSDYKFQEETEDDMFTIYKYKNSSNVISVEILKPKYRNNGHSIYSLMESQSGKFSSTYGEATFAHVNLEYIGIFKIYDSPNKIYVSQSYPQIAIITDDVDTGENFALTVKYKTEKESPNYYKYDPNNYIFDADGNKMYWVQEDGYDGSYMHPEGTNGPINS